MLTELGPDDHGDTRASATELAEGVTTGHLERPSDVDWFAFAPEPGRIYEASASGGVTLELTDATSQPVPGSRFAATSTSPWFNVRIARSGTLTSTTYVLTIARVGLDDSGDTAATATHVPLSTVFRGVNE